MARMPRDMWLGEQQLDLTAEKFGIRFVEAIRRMLPGKSRKAERIA